MQETQIQTLGIENLKEMYQEDSDFKEAYEACKTLVNKDRIPWLDYMIQDGLLFKRSQFCIPKFPMREFNPRKEQWWLSWTFWAG